MMKSTTITGFFISIFLFTQSVFAQVAFPGAEGAGKFATGGRGTLASPTVIYEVTNLGDANTMGSFRYAVTNNSAVLNRTVIFKVSGTIKLTSPLTLNRANTTIAGQTAPGDGICIANYPVTIGANNIIIRYVRFRMGDQANTAASDYDALGGRGRKHIIIDHCTASWGVDETLSFYENDSSTIQYTIISEPLNNSYHNEGSGFETHGFGGIWGGKLVSFHHNLFAHCQGRTPRFDGIRNIPEEKADFRNNVIYNWGDYNVNGGEGGKYNVAHNYYKWGPSTPTAASPSNDKRRRLLQPYKETSPVIPYGKFYLNGNYVDGYPDVTTNNWMGVVMNGGSASDTPSANAYVPYDIVPITSYTAQQAYQQVLKSAGAILPKRDTLDQRIMNNVINRTGTLINVQGGYPAYTPYATSSQTAWPTLNSVPAPDDVDKDGMADAWELRRGLNPAVATDRQAINQNGYTNLENYLNGDSIVAVGTVNTCVTTKSIFATNTNEWINAKDSNYSNVVPMDSMNVVASINDNGNFGEFAVSYYVTNTTRFDANNKPYLNRNITITPSNPALITSPVTVRIYITNAEYLALKNADNSITSVSDLRIVKVPHAIANNCATDMSGTPVVITPTATGVFGTYQNGYFLEFQTSSFSSFFVMSAAAAPVPLDLLSFTATLASGQVKTAWTTANQVNVSHFVIERSNNSQNFQPRGNVSAINTVNNQAYSFIDADPLKGVSYYRLKIVDIDGRFKYSPIVSVNNKQASVITLMPNPVKNSLTVVYPSATSGASIWIFAADGKKVMEYEIKSAGTSSTLNVSSLERGLYELIFINGDEKLNTRFLKQ